MKKMLLMLVAACGSLGVMAEGTSAVAKIGDAEYTTLQGAIDAAIEAGTAQIDICANIDMGDTALTLAGNGIDTTAITFNLPADYTVTLAEGSDTFGATTGMNIDNATVVFEGAGTWKKTGNSTVFRIGEETAAANVTINGGVFEGYQKVEGNPPSNLFNLQQGTLVVNGGTFTTEAARVIRVRNTGVVTVNGGTFYAINKGGTDSGTASIFATSGGTAVIPSTSTAKFKGIRDDVIISGMTGFIAKDETDENTYGFVKGADGYFTVAAEGTAAVKVGEIPYAEFDAALQAAIAAKTATVTVLKDFTFTNTIYMVGAGADETKITIENNCVVGFPYEYPRYGIFVDGLTLTLTGNGTWQKPIESASMFLAGEKSAAANIIVESGNFYAAKASCLFNVQTGTITVNGGTFKTDNADGWCVRAEKSDVDSTQAGTVIINGGTFVGPTNGTSAVIGIKNASSVAAGAKVLINIDGDIKLDGTWAAIGLTEQYLVVTNEDGTYTAATGYEFVKGADGYFTVAAEGTAVAKVGEVPYAEFDAALQAAIAAKTATVTVLKDFTFTNTIYMVGAGADETKITIENNCVVGFPYEYPRYGIFVDGLTLTLTGNGTWQKPIESASMFLAGEKSAAANIIVESGNFYAAAASCIFNVQLGMITVNGGTFKTDNADGGKCVRAEMSDVDKTKAGIVLINGGSFEGPSNGATGLIAIKNQKSVDAGAEVWIDVAGDITLKGSATAIEQTSEYFRIKGTDADGVTTYTETGDYKFADKDGDGVYTICAIEWATLTLNFDEAKVQNVTVTDAAKQETVFTKTKSQYKCDKDDAEVLTLAVVCQDGYELDMAAADLTVTMDQDREVTIVVKAGEAKYAAVEAGSTTTCASEADATAYAAAINAYKSDLIKAPGDMTLTGDNLTKYVALFEATANGTDVTVGFTDAAQTALQKVVDDATVNFAMDESAAVFTVTNATPGLYYVLWSGVEKPTDLSKADVIQAGSSTVTFHFATEGYDQGFFKLEACATNPETAE